MGQPESDCHNCEGEPGKRPNWDGVEFFVNEVAKQKSAPKNLLDQRNDDYEANKTDYNRGPVRRWPAGKNFGIESSDARCETQDFLGRNPQRENKERNRGGEENLPDWAKRILATKPEEQRATKYHLGRVDPILRRIEPEGAAYFSEDAAQAQQNKKRHHWQGESRQLPPIKFGICKIHLVFRLNG